MMDNDENFYIHLNSNVSESFTESFCDENNQNCEIIERKNSIGNFINRLNRRIVLKGEWEVSLTNIQYRKSWLNVHQDQQLQLVDMSGTVYTLDASFPSGNYVDPIEMIKKLNEIYED